MASGIFGIGASALGAAQAGLLTAGHNIANANTAGYSRQRTEQSANLPQFTGSGYFGQGVRVEVELVLQKKAHRDVDEAAIGRGKGEQHDERAEVEEDLEADGRRRLGGHDGRFCIVRGSGGHGWTVSPARPTLAGRAERAPVMETREKDAVALFEQSVSTRLRTRQAVVSLI